MVLLFPGLLQALQPRLLTFNRRGMKRITTFRGHLLAVRSEPSLLKLRRNLSLLSHALTVGGLLWCGYVISKNLFPDPILTAAEAGDTAQVEALLNKGANIEAKNGTGMTPLMRAAEFGRIETVKVLLARGANISASDDSGCTALRVAASPEGHAETVAFLLKSGAKPNVTDNEGRTALLWASAYGNAETVQTLIAHGADVNLRDRSGKTALLMAAGDKQELPSNPGNAESEKALRGAGAR